MEFNTSSLLFRDEVFFDFMVSICFGGVCIRVKTKRIISSALASACTLTAALFIKDNQSLVFQLFMWLGSLVLLAVGTAIGVLVSFAVSGGAYAIYSLWGRIFGNQDMNAPLKRQKFFKRFYVVFFFCTFVVLAKFLSDFAFAQIVGTYIFLCGAIGFVHGAFIAITFAGQKKMNKNTIWID